MKLLDVSQVINGIRLLTFFSKGLMFFLIFIIVIMLIIRLKNFLKDYFKRSKTVDKDLFFDKQLIINEDTQKACDISKEVIPVIAAAVGYIYSSNDKKYKIHSIKRIFHADNRLD